MSCINGAYGVAVTQRFVEPLFRVQLPIGTHDKNRRKPVFEWVAKRANCFARVRELNSGMIPRKLAG